MNSNPTAPATVSTTSAVPRLMSKREVMAMLGVSERTVEKLVAANKFPPPLHLGRSVRWAAPAVERWLVLQLERQLNWAPRKRTGASVSSRA